MLAPAPRRWPASFEDRLGFALPGWRDFLRIARTGGFGDPRAQAPLGAHVPRGEPPDLHDAPRRARVTWAGHASFVVQLGGLTLLTDPVWSERIAVRVRRVTRPGVPWDALPAIDGVVFSHNHYDHLDAATVRRLPRSTPMFVPAKLGAWFRRRGFRDVRELDWWETEDHDGGAEITFVPCQHWSRRGLFDENRTLWGSWVMRERRGGASVFFTGDTGYCRWFAEVGARFPGLDLALLPMGAYAPDWFMQNVHQTPEQAVQAFQDLGARAMVPSHWGTFVLSREPLLEPPERLRAEWHRRGLAPERLWDLALGEGRDLEAPP